LPELFCSSSSIVSLSIVAQSFDQLTGLVYQIWLHGELLCTVKIVIDVNVDPPNWPFSGDYISALRGCMPLMFSQALEIDQGLLAHDQNK